LDKKKYTDYNIRSKKEILPQFKHQLSSTEKLQNLPHGIQPPSHRTLFQGERKGKKLNLAGGLKHEEFRNRGSRDFFSKISSPLSALLTLQPHSE